MALFKPPLRREGLRGGEEPERGQGAEDDEGQAAQLGGGEIAGRAGVGMLAASAQVEGGASEVEDGGEQQQVEAAGVDEPDAVDGACHAQGEAFHGPALVVAIEIARGVEAGFPQEEAAEEVGREHHHAGDVDGRQIHRF